MVASLTAVLLKLPTKHELLPFILFIRHIAIDTYYEVDDV